MNDFGDIRQLIENAIQEEQTLFIRYRDYHGNVSVRKITPLEWLGPQKIHAFCHLRDAERDFILPSILEVSTIEIPEDVEPEPEPEFESKSEAKENHYPVESPFVLSIPRTAPTKTTTSQPNRIISKIKTADEWTHLLNYYRECLQHEYQQQFSFKKNSFLPLNISKQLLYEFLSGTSNLILKKEHCSEKFLNFLDSSKNRNQQLCLGKSFFYLNSEKISPIFFVPVTVENDIENITLKSEEFSLSYAGLMNLGFKAEEITDYLEGYQRFLESQPVFQDVEQYVLNNLSERLSRPLTTYSDDEYSIDQVEDYSIFKGTGFFWVSNKVTGNLISELQELSKPEYWQNLPQIISFLINQFPGYDLSPVPGFIEDERFYVTNINDQQRKAARSVAEHPITIVTGPPGTGKSQLVLNLIAEASMKGESVLFASHNNKAVDVVMDRLQNDIQFQGAIRTGNTANRRRAVQQMESAISHIYHQDIQQIEKNYQQGKVELKNASDQLDRIRDLLGKIHSYQLEKEDILRSIPNEWATRIKDISLPFVEDDKQRMNEILSELIEIINGLVHRHQDIVFDIGQLIQNKDETNPSLLVIREFENQWGVFAGGLMRTDGLLTLQSIISYCKAWLVMLSAMASKKQFNLAKADHQSIKNQIDHMAQNMSEDQNSAALLLCDKLPKEKCEFEFQQLIKMRQDFSITRERKPNIFLQIALKLNLYDPYKKYAKFIHEKQIMLWVSENESKSQKISPEEVDQSFSQIIAIFQLSKLLYEMQIQQQNLDLTQKAYLNSIADLEADQISNLDRLNLVNFDAAPLLKYFQEVESKALKAQLEFNKMFEKCSRIFIKNQEQIKTIDAFIKLNQGEKQWDAYGLIETITEKQLLSWAQLWQKIVVIWEDNAVIAHSKKQLEVLPSEDKALNILQKTNQTLFNLAGELLRANWNNRATEASNEIFEGTKNYISAVKQLNNLEFGHSDSRSLKQAERNNLKFALEMFPVWALTSLTAKTNLPLKAGLFDLVIIDEASQCDIPSALPLIYRAKKVVIIGDPNQLRHVASLDKSFNFQIGRKFGIGLEAFSYNDTSLYDLGEKALGNKPGAILLDEHYRSDPRIINFSNEVFYDSRLIIKTDLTKRGFKKTFINQKGGGYWLHVKGEFQRPPSGSANNSKEIEQIKNLVPKLIDSLDQEGFRNATIGIVTPFRDQENIINEWITKTYPENKRIISGTAHQFQGDECDVVIFSPVISGGVLPGTLKWLEDTCNLLNVAITRARLCLIVVGDFEFCYHDLSSTSLYHRLAAYFEEKLHRVCQSEEEIPLLGDVEPEESYQIVGTLTDPSNSEFNRTNLIRFISSCRGFVYWVDPYFDRKIIDLLDNLYRNKPYPEINEYRIMTAERQVKSFEGIPCLKPESIIKAKKYLNKVGVSFDVRILPGEELPHDRFLYHPGGAINMPPFGGAYGAHRHLSEYTPSKTTIELFNSLWNKGVPIESYIANEIEGS
jgi:superfamily I DNA and/or RNA helicase